jgi:hypothetical protein
MNSIHKSGLNMAPGERPLMLSKGALGFVKCKDVIR